MKIQTIPQIVRSIKTVDPATAVNESMLSTLISSGNLPHERHGNRMVSDLDIVIPYLNRMLGLEETTAIPHLRTIRGAAQEIKSHCPELGLSEDHIRAAVCNGRIDCIRIGNRVYIAMEFFENPYVQRFTQMKLTSDEHQFKPRDGTHEQIGQLVARSQSMPVVQRIRKAK